MSAELSVREKHHRGLVRPCVASGGDSYPGQSGTTGTCRTLAQMFAAQHGSGKSCCPGDRLPTSVSSQPRDPWRYRQISHR